MRLSWLAVLTAVLLGGSLLARPAAASADGWGNGSPSYSNPGGNHPSWPGNDGGNQPAWHDERPSNQQDWDGDNHGNQPSWQDNGDGNDHWWHDPSDPPPCTGSITSQSGQNGPVVCGSSTAVGTAEHGGNGAASSCSGGTSYAGARGQGSLALSLACQGSGAGSTAGNWGGAASLSVVPGNTQLSSLSLAVDGGTALGGATSGGASCITTGTGIAVASVSGDQSCITIDGVSYTGSTAPLTLYSALNSAGITTHEYDDLVPWCLRGVASAIYTAARTDTGATIPVVYVDSNVYHRVCG